MNKDNWNKGNDAENTAKEVNDFLQKNYPNAYTYEEIIMELDLKPYGDALFDWAY